MQGYYLQSWAKRDGKNTYNLKKLQAKLEYQIKKTKKIKEKREKKENFFEFQGE